MKIQFIGLIRVACTLAVACLSSAGIQSCCGCSSDDFTKGEVSVIREFSSGKSVPGTPEGTMRVLTIADSCDNALLRRKSSDLSAKALLSEDYAALERLMVTTVTHPSQDGVGIAGPQVGLNRRVVAVQRFDKEGEPFEVYPNVSIVWMSDSLAYGPEGCLSVPDRRGDVLRSQEIVIEYADLEQIRSGILSRPLKHESEGHETTLPTRRDTIKGFTAVIFQHEIDHLDGILYIDRL